MRWRRALTSRPYPNARQTPLVSGKAPQIRVAVSETPMITNGDRLPDVMSKFPQHDTPCPTHRYHDPHGHEDFSKQARTVADNSPQALPQIAGRGLDGSGFDHCLSEIAANMSDLADVFLPTRVWCSHLTSATRLLDFASCWLYPNLR